MSKSKNETLERVESFLLGVMENSDEKTENRLAAAAQLMKSFSTEKVRKNSDGWMDDFGEWEEKMPRKRK